MKKYLNFMAFAILAVFSLTFVSCSSDDDDKPSVGNSELVGTWALQDRESGYWEADEDFEYIQLKADGTFIDIQGDEYEDKGYSVSYGKWSVADNELVLKITSGFWQGTTWTYDLIKKEKDQIIVKMWGITAYLVRVNDDIIQKYL